MKVNTIKNESGISLMVLVLTVVIMLILTVSVVFNYQQYGEYVKRAHFTEDITKLNEEITQYYSRYKQLPIINKYTNVSQLQSVKNVNDGADYYVIDLDRLNLKLEYGKDYDVIKTKNVSEEISLLTDVYIVNSQSHTVYYPQGIEINGTTYYKLTENYTSVNGKTQIVIPPVAKTNLVYNESAQELITAGSATIGTMQYKLNDGEYSTAIPTATNVGSYTVYYKVVGDPDNNSQETSISVTIGKKANTLVLSSNSETVNFGTPVTVTVDTNESNGTLSVSSDDTEVANATISGNTVTITAEQVSEESTATITVTSAETATYSEQEATIAVTVPVAGKVVKLADGTYSQPITADNISDYIGTEVEYAPTGGGIWRIFYLDTKNKYGDGAGTVYIKRDYDSSTTFNDSDHASYNSSKGALEKFNPYWKICNSGYDARNEYVSAYLCYEINWNNTYKNTSGYNKAKYAIGSPSVEMYIDAYNQWGKYESGKGPLCYDFVPKTTGYDLGVNGSYPNLGYGYLNSNSLSTGPNNIFMNQGFMKYWWLASPARYSGSSNYMLFIDGSDEKTIKCNYDKAYGICPIVALE